MRLVWARCSHSSAYLGTSSDMARMVASSALLSPAWNHGPGTLDGRSIGWGGLGQHATHGSSSAALHREVDAWTPVAWTPVDAAWTPVSTAAQTSPSPIIIQSQSPFVTPPPSFPFLSPLRPPAGRLRRRLFFFLFANGVKKRHFYRSTQNLMNLVDARLRIRDN